MATLTITQIAQLALNAGIQQGNNLYVCVSIAMAESSGSTDVVHHNSDQTKDVGVWQINDVHSVLWGPTDDRTDPVQNAKYMYAISGSGTNWQPWTTYTDGSYQNFMQQVMSAVQTANLTRGTQVPVGTPNTLGGGYGAAPSKAPTATQPAHWWDNIPGVSGAEQAYQTIDKFFKFITSPDGWVRIMKVGIGVILVIAGIDLLMKTEIMTAAKIGAKAAML